MSGTSVQTLSCMCFHACDGLMRLHVWHKVLSVHGIAGTMTKMANKMPRHKAAGAVAVALCCTADVFLRGWQKATPRHPWLQGHERLPEILQWLDKASPGDVRYESEGMWLLVEERDGDRLVIRDFDGPEYVIVVLCRAQNICLDEMD